MSIFGKDLEELLQKTEHLRRHGVKLMDVGVGVDVAETRADWIVDEQHVGELVPTAVVEQQVPILVHTVGTDFHHCAIHATAPGSSVQPDDRPPPVCNVAILIKPEEQIAVMFWRDLYVSSIHVEKW